MERDIHQNQHVTPLYSSCLCNVKMTDETASTPFAVVDVDTKRKRLLYQGRPIYDWEQSLTDIEVFITPPVSLFLPDHILIIVAVFITIAVLLSFH